MNSPLRDNKGLRRARKFGVKLARNPDV